MSVQLARIRTDSVRPEYGTFSRPPGKRSDAGRRDIEPLEVAVVGFHCRSGFYRPLASAALGCGLGGEPCSSLLWAFPFSLATFSSGQRYGQIRTRNEKEGKFQQTDFTYLWLVIFGGFWLVLGSLRPSPEASCVPPATVSWVRGRSIYLINMSFIGAAINACQGSRDSLLTFFLVEIGPGHP